MLPFDVYRAYKSPYKCAQRIVNHIINLGLSQRKVILAEFNRSTYQCKENSDKNDLSCPTPALGQ